MKLSWPISSLVACRCGFRVSLARPNSSRRRRRRNALLRLPATAMLHLQKRLLLSFCPQWLLSVARLAATASAAVSPAPAAPFSAQDYLVTSCGLTRDRAGKVSKWLSHLKSPSNPDAVRSFLSGLGLSPHDIAAAVDRYPRLLCCQVDKTLAPRVAELRDFGLSPDQITRLILLHPGGFPRPSTVSKLKYFLVLFGSMDNLLYAMKRSTFFFNCDMERVVKPNVSLLREWGLDELDISKLCSTVPRLLCTRHDRFQAIAARVEGIGVPRGTRMFRHALNVLAYQPEENIGAMFEFLKKTFQWSNNQVSLAVAKNPFLLTVSKDRACRAAGFLISEVGLDPEYIAHRPALIKYSLEGRLIPRHYVVRFLKANGLLDPGRDYYCAVSITERVFVEKFIVLHKEAAPHLAEDYADACKGKVSPRFRPQELGTRLANV